MIGGRKVRLLLVCLSIVMLTAVFVFFHWNEGRTCLGVRILTEENLRNFSEYQYQNLRDVLTFQGELAAIDEKTSTIYISQDIGPKTTYQDLVGEIQCMDARFMLYFRPDGYFSHLSDAVRENHSFNMIVTDGSQTYMEYDVVFTTLPVIRVDDGEFFYMREDGREEYKGNICVWNPKDPETNAYSVKSSNITSHARGRSALALPKQPRKISLKKENGDNQDLSLLGLGADDDWILNAMGRDDTNMREKLFMDLWNEMAQDSPWNDKMSTGEYVELVRKGEYRGLYLLQRRLDGKYLELQEEDILMKGLGTWSADTVEDGYEIVSSQLPQDRAIALMEGIRSLEDVSCMNVDNFIDTNIFLTFASAPDNVSFYNMYYVLRPTDGEYEISLLPWDTDMSFGLIWNTDFTYNYESSLKSILTRRETYAMEREHPDFKQKTYERWQMLRKDVLTYDHIVSYLDQYMEKLEKSGVLTRDQQKWGLQYNGEDTVEKLYRFMEEKLTLLDNYYLEQAKNAE